MISEFVRPYVYAVRRAFVAAAALHLFLLALAIPPAYCEEEPVEPVVPAVAEEPDAAAEPAAEPAAEAEAELAAEPGDEPLEAAEPAEGGEEPEVAGPGEGGEEPGEGEPGEGGEEELAEETEPPVDAVFLVDSSSSIYRTDPDKAREVLIEAFSGFLWARPGDRIAVAQFAGWEETKNNVAVPVPLVEIPADYESRKKLLEDMRTKLAGMKPFGTATDMNAALEIALGEVEVARGEAKGRSLWAIVITDGGFDVVEGNSAREEYIKKAEAEYPPVGPDTLSRAASDIFFATTLPALKERGISISFMALGCAPDNLGEFFQRAADTADCRVLCTKDLHIRDVFVDLLRSCPARDNSDIPSYGFSKATAEPGQEVLVPLRVLPGTKRTRAVLFATSSEFDVSLTTPDGIAIDDPKLTALGDGTPYRVAWIEAARPGEYALKIVNKGENPLDVEFAIFGEVALKLMLAWPDDTDAHLMGAPASVTASLADTVGRPIADQPTLLETRIVLVMEDEQGNLLRSTTSFEEAEDGKLKAKVPTAGLVSGLATATARLQAYPIAAAEPAAEGDVEVRYIFESPSQSHPFRLLPGVMVEFASSDAFVSQVIGLVAKCSDDVLNPPEEFTVALEPEATVSFTRTDDGYSGSITFNEPGTWKLLRGRDPSVLFAPGEIGAVTVVERSIRILSAEPPNGELVLIECPVKYIEKTGTEVGMTPPYIVPVIIEMDVAEGETLSAKEALFRPSREFKEKGLKDEVVSFAFGDAKEAEPGKARLATTLALSINTEDMLPQDIGIVEITAVVQGVEGTKRVPVKLNFVDYWEKLFWHYMPYWLPAVIVLGLLLVSLFWIALRARFKYHQIRPVATLGKQEFLLRGMGSSGSRDAIGTPEAEGAVHFRVRGHRPFTRGKVRIRRQIQDAQVLVNGVELGSGWARIRHGDEITVVMGTGLKVAYWYFDREPTEAELEEMLKSFFIELGPDEFVIMGL